LQSQDHPHGVSQYSHKLTKADKYECKTRLIPTVLTKPAFSKTELHEDPVHGRGSENAFAAHGAA
jgi:hypothetical protein